LKTDEVRRTIFSMGLVLVRDNNQGYPVLSRKCFARNSGLNAR